MFAKLKKAGVHTKLKVLKGKEHNFDYEPSAEEEFGQPGGLFEQAIDFLKGQLLRYDNDLSRVEHFLILGYNSKTARVEK